MALPKQVQAALDAADQTLAQLSSESQQGSGDQIDMAQLEVTNQPAQPADVQQAQPQELQVEPVEPPVATPQPDAKWEDRYRVLQGKYNAEVPQLHRQVQSLQQELTQAVQKMNELTSQPRQEAKPQPEAADPKDIENFGVDLVAMVQRVAQSVIGQVATAIDGKLSAFNNRFASIEEQLQGATQTVAMTAEQTFFDRLSKMVPDWETVNTDPSFLAWLLEADPVYGISRQNALNQAQKTLNAEHAASVFRAFLGNAPGRTAAAKVDVALDQQVSPKSVASPQPTPAVKQTITARQVEKFYSDVARGQYRGKEAEAAQIEQFINAALAEGRVVG